MALPDKLRWTDVDDIALELFERYPDRDPLAVRFTELRDLVQRLPNFEEEPGHPVNEKILETIQARWYEEVTDAKDEEEA